MRHEIKHSTKSRRLRYPWDDMAIGDYFEVPFEAVTENNIRMQAYFRNRKKQGWYSVARDLYSFRITRRK